MIFFVLNCTEDVKMVHPIAGRNQYPFTINGIIVDGAKIQGVEFVKGLFIYKQRSAIVYDLIDVDGVIYEFVEITWTSTDGVDLDYFDNSSVIVKQIKDNSFFIKIQDIQRNIFGFITLMQLNKVKVHTGDYIYYNQDDDYSLLSVRCIPATVQAKKNDIVSIGVQFMPEDFPNTNGVWSASNTAVAQMGRSISPNATFDCLEIGHTIVVFNPDANTKLAATAHIYVTEKEPDYHSFIAIINDVNGNNIPYYPGEEFTYTVIYDPYSFVPSEPLSVSFDDSVLEYLGSTDNINYNFKVLDTAKLNGMRTEITFSDGLLVAYGNPSIRQLSTSKTIDFTGPTYTRVGEKYQYKFSTNNRPSDPNYTWGVSNPAIGSISSSGELTVTGTGEQYVYLYANGNTSKNNYKIVKCSYNIPDMYVYTPNDTFSFVVGESYQLSVSGVPSTVDISGGGWYTNSSYSDYYAISQTGLLTILKVPDNPEQMFYVKYVNKGSSSPSGDGTVLTGAYNSQRTFCIVPSDFEQKPTSVVVSSSSNDGNLYIPLDGSLSSNIVVSPYNTTVSREWSVELDDPSICELDYNPYYANNYISSPLVVHGIKRGQTNAILRLVADPTITKSFTITVI